MSRRQLQFDKSPKLVKMMIEIFVHLIKFKKPNPKNKKKKKKEEKLEKFSLYIKKMITRWNIFDNH